MIEMASGLGATTVGIGVSHGTGVSEPVTGGCRLRAQSQSQASNSPSQHSNPQQSSQQQQQQQQQSSQQQQQRQGPGFMGRSKKDNCCLCWCCCCSCSNKCLAAVSGGNSSGADGKKKGGGGESIDPDDGKGGDRQGGGNGLDWEGDISDISLEEIRAWGSSFDRLMRNPAGRTLFREFLVSEYSDENIAFWLACEQLKEENDPKKVEEKARFIYEDYISILSPKEVSLDSRVREIVNRNMVDPSPHTFDEAQLQIYTLMHRDSYPRFVNSEIFKRGARIGSGPPSPMCAEHDHEGSIGKSKSKKSMT